MILVICLACHNAIRVKGQKEEIDYLIGPSSDFWPDGFICPTCDGHVEGYLENEVSEGVLRTLTIRDLTPVEAFSTFCGAGLPEDRICKGEVVSTLLREVPIRKVIGEDIPNTTRFRIDHIELWDGPRIYFGASGDGPIIYRITKERTHG